MNSPEDTNEITPAETSPAATKHTSAAAIPSSEQLAITRAAHWHQDEKPLLTMEGLRNWINACGLVAYGPRVAQMGAPAPSLIEATLGKKLDAAAELSDGDAGRSLLARLVAEGSVVPLNLLGVTGGVGTDVPDYVASASVFSYIFTLRGNKAWKQAPVTAGAVKVSPLALATYEMLSAKVMLSSYDLATQLGKEVTEGAVLRSLTELWSQLRVIPVAQTDGTATLWELSTARFTKQIKAGANAGQPSALSALISLYLGQAMAATEDEVETFLSPLAPRSRVRDVIHALLAARQLETLVIDGKTLLHVAGELPVFAAASVLETTEEQASGEGVEPGSRISKFAAKPGSKIGTGLRSKPAFGKKPAYGSKPAFGAKPAFGDRERRPFKSADTPGFAKPRFDKPWTEKPARPAAAEGFVPQEGASESAAAPRREYAPRKTFSKPGTFTRKREGFEGKPSFDRGEGRPPRRDAGSDSRPPRRDFGGDARPPRRDFGADSRPPRREFSSDSRPPRRDAGERSERPAGTGFKRTGASAGSYSPRPKPAFGDKPSFGAKPSFGSKPSFGRKPFGDKPAFGSKPPYKRASEGGGDDAAPRKTYRKFDAPRDKPFGAKPSGAKPYTPRPAGERSERPARTFDGRPAGSDRPRSEGRPSFGSKPPFRGKSSDTFGVKNQEGGEGKRPYKKAGGFAGAGGPFAKFADGKKPFRKPGPGKPSGAARGGKPAGDGYRPTKRRAE